MDALVKIVHLLNLYFNQLLCKLEYLASIMRVVNFLIFVTFTSAMVSRSLRQQVLARQGGKCGLCRRKFSRMIPHEIHHLNHVHKDDRSSNLLALCPNCHGAHHRYGVSVQPWLSEYNHTLMWNDTKNDWVKLNLPDDYDSVS